MTNRDKKSHFAKSKILLITLCILGLAFSYSCSCRNDKITGGDDGTLTDTNEIPKVKVAFVTGEDANNTHLIRLKSDGTDGDSAIIKFTNNAIVELGHIDNGSTGLGFIKTDFNYADGKLSLNDEGKKKLTEAGKSNIIKVNFNLSTTSDNYTDETKNQTKSVDIAIGKIKVWDMKKDVVDVLLALDTSIKTASGMEFMFKDGEGIGNGEGIKLKPRNNTDEFDDGIKVGKKQFGDKLIARLSNSYYNKGLFNKVEVKDDLNTLQPVGTTITFNLDLTPSTFYTTPTSYVGFEIIADLKWSDSGTSKTGVWE